MTSAVTHKLSRRIPHNMESLIAPPERLLIFFTAMTTNALKAGKQAKRWQ